MKRLCAFMLRNLYMRLKRLKLGMTDLRTCQVCALLCASELRVQTHTDREKARESERECVCERVSESD